MKLKELVELPLFEKVKYDWLHWFNKFRWFRHGCWKRWTLRSGAKPIN